MSAEEHPFVRLFKGNFRSALRWDDLDRLFAVAGECHEGQWYIYQVGEAPPGTPADQTAFRDFLGELRRLLHREHDEDYCGIVYADDFTQPSFIKVYDPNNLGSVCGPGFGPPPLPGWILSTVPPVDLDAAMPPPANRRRWWQRLFGG